MFSGSKRIFLASVLTLPILIGFIIRRAVLSVIFLLLFVSFRFRTVWIFILDSYVKNHGRSLKIKYKCGQQGASLQSDYFQFTFCYKRIKVIIDLFSIFLLIFNVNIYVTIWNYSICIFLLFHPSVGVIVHFFCFIKRIENWFLSKS